MSVTDFDKDIHYSGSSSTKLAEWIEKVKREEMTAPGSSYGVVSNVISDDLLGIWLNTADSAAQKVSIRAINNIMLPHMHAGYVALHVGTVLP